MSPPVYPNPLGPLDILTANYVNSMVDGIDNLTQASDGRILQVPTAFYVHQTGYSAPFVSVELAVTQIKILINGVVCATNSGTTTVVFNDIPDAPDAVYYIYAYVDSGTLLTFEASSTAPSIVDARWKSGAVGTHRYVGAFGCVAASGIGGVPSYFKTYDGNVFFVSSDAKYAGACVATSSGHASRSVTMPKVVPQSAFSPNVVVFAFASPASAPGVDRNLSIKQGSSYAALASGIIPSGSTAGIYFNQFQYKALSGTLYIDDPDEPAGPNTDVSIAIVGYADPWNP